MVGLTFRRASLQRRGLKHCTKRSKKGEQRGEIYDAAAARGIGAKLGPLPEVHTLAIFADGIEEHYGTQLQLLMCPTPFDVPKTFGCQQGRSRFRKGRQKTHEWEGLLWCNNSESTMV